MVGVYKDKLDYNHHPIRILLDNLQRYDATRKTRRGKKLKYNTRRN